MQILFLLVFFLMAGCGSNHLVQEDPWQAGVAENALQKGDFENARQEALDLLETNPGNPKAKLIVAIISLKIMLADLNQEFVHSSKLFKEEGIVNFKIMTLRLEKIQKELAVLYEDLKIASQDPSLFLNLCPACWENIKGKDLQAEDKPFVNPHELRDKKKISEDGKSKPVEIEYRFDQGDIYWLMGNIALARAFLDFVNAYESPEFKELMEFFKFGNIVLWLKGKKNIFQVKAYLWDALENFRLARLAILAENDDEREWIPNPKQKNHFCTHCTGDEFYGVWEELIAGLGNLLRGEEGLSLQDIAFANGKQNQLTGFINVGKMLDEPGNIILEVKLLKIIAGNGDLDDLQQVLRSFVGENFSEEMKASSVIHNLQGLQLDYGRGKKWLVDWFGQLWAGK